MTQPWLLLVMTGAGLYVLRLWLGDRKAHRRNEASAHSLPGAVDAPLAASVIALGGTLVLLSAETWLEKKLGLAGQQSHLTWLFGLYSVTAAPVIEEIIFRGYLATGLAQASDGRPRPRVVIWSGVIAASVGFALLHPFLWHWGEAGFGLTLDAKGWFSSAAAFATSLWLYVARLAPWNPGHSLLPCFVGHGGKNLGVLVIKHAQGFVTGWF
jgi:membrane protease YdiL (CAAX protease family)